MYWFLALISLLVPRGTRRRWLEEWRAELCHARWTMVLGAIPDAWALRRLHHNPQQREPGGWRGPWRTDAKQTVRSLARSPWHVLTVSLCLGIGIAVCVTAFSILATVLTGTLPGIQDRERLMRLYVSAEEFGRPSTPGNASLSDYEVLKQGTPSMPSIAVEGGSQFAVRTPAGAAAIRGAFVSGNYFDALGTRPALGRLLAPHDDRPDAPLAVVLSHAFWTSQLGAPPDIVGSTILVGGHDMHVVGVTPEGFSGTDIGDLGEAPGVRFRIYVPLARVATLAPAVGSHEEWLTVVARAAPDRSRDVLAAELEPLAARVAVMQPILRRNAAVTVHNSGMQLRDTPGTVALIVTLMMAAPLTVLAIGCANAANLQLVRASLRRRELAVRVSIGASRAQLVRLLTFESALLALAACAAGALGTWLLLQIAAVVIPLEITIDWLVFVFVLAVAVGVVLATGVLPAWLVTRHHGGLGVSATRRAITGSGSRARRGLVIAQLALSLLLLLPASLFTRSLDTLTGRVPEAARHILVAEMRFDTLAYSDPQRTAFIEGLTSRLKADARVEEVGLSSAGPLRSGGRRFWLPGDGPERVRAADGGDVTAGWFAASDARLLRGRTFTTEDARLGDVAVVNQAFVEKYRLVEPVLGSVVRFEPPGGGDPDAPVDPRHVSPGESVAFSNSGRRGTSRPRGDVRIVGVVGNGLYRPVFRQPPASVYLAMRDVANFVAVYVRSDRPGEVAQQVRETMAALDPNLPAVAISTLAERFDADAGDIRLLARAASGLGAAALLLAVAGVYSVIAFFVSLRTHEFGIRLAIGARPRDITNMVTMQAARLVSVGLVTGFILAIPVLVLLGKEFPYTSAFDPVGLLVPVSALALTALVAARVPARKAARVDPCTALRSE